MARASLKAILSSRINGKAYIRDNDAFMLQAIKDAGRAFIEAAEPRIPVKSGMSKGSLMADVHYRGKIQDAFSFFDTDFLILPIEFDKKYYVQPGQRNLGRVNVIRHDDPSKYKSEGWLPKDPETGAAISKYTIKRATGKDHRITFIFDSGVRHYNYNEFLRNWRSQQVGMTAFHNSLKKSLKKGIPNLLDYLEYIHVSGGKGTGIAGKQRLKSGRYTKGY